MYKQYSLICSAIIIAFLIIENYLYSPEHLWFIYVIYPIIWWPILMYLDEKAKTLKIALIGFATTIIYYSLLNIILSHPYPWAIYPAFLVTWWPLAIYHAQRKTFVAFSVTASMLIIIFFYYSKYCLYTRSYMGNLPNFCSLVVAPKHVFLCL